MATIHDVDVNQLIEKTGQELSKISSIQPPEWSKYVKTGVHKERPPTRADWWYVRAAAVLRMVYVLGPIGVSKLRTKYGGRKHRGFKPEKFMKGSGNILRKILQQLEKAGFTRQTQIGNRKGRILTPKGKSFINKVAGSIYVKAPKAQETAEESPAEETQEKPVETSKKESAADAEE